MGAGVSTVGSAPAQLSAGEILWRLIDFSWYRQNANGIFVIEEIAFIGCLSFIRSDYLCESDVDGYQDNRGINKFIKAGIAVLDSGVVIARTRAALTVTGNSYGWLANTHVELIRQSGGKSHSEVLELTSIANSNAMLRIPKP
jgi:hypothetical protein